MSFRLMRRVRDKLRREHTETARAVRVCETDRKLRLGTGTRMMVARLFRKEKSMLLMVLIMTLPLFGIALFFTLPIRVALPAYLVMAGFSGLYHCLMMRAMRLPVCTGAEKMAGSMAMVLNWQEGSGQIIREGEIWHSESKDRRLLVRGQKVAVSGMSGLTLRVIPAGDHVNQRAWVHSGTAQGRDSKRREM